MIISETRRLVLAKSLFLHACSHAEQRDEVSRMLAIHNFDLTVDMVVKCVATKCKVVPPPRKEYGFKKLWDDVSNQGVHLPFRDQIFSLHDVRNLVQHAGIVPSHEDVLKFKNDVEDFLREVIKGEFGILFEELSLADLVESTDLREMVHRAEEALRNERYEDSIRFCDEALMKATFDVGDIFGKAGLLTGYFGASDELKRIISKDYAKKYRGKNLYAFAKEVSKAVLQLGQASTGMQFLDAFRNDFLRFRKIVDDLPATPRNELRRKCLFSIDFLVRLVLKWQEEGIL